jgi:hypothetical protein
MSAAMSAADAQEAVELRAYVRAYETALNEVLKSGEFNVTPRMAQDIKDIVDQNPNPLIRVHLLYRRLKGTDLGQRVYAKAILGNDHGLAEHQREQKIKYFKDLMKRAALQAAQVGQQKAIERDYLPLRQTIAERTYRSGTYVEHASSTPQPLTDPLTIVLKKTNPKPRGGKKSYKKSHKKGGKKSHKKRTHGRRH